jgi:hypothetical protein
MQAYVQALCHLHQVYIQVHNNSFLFKISYNPAYI